MEIDQPLNSLEEWRSLAAKYHQALTQEEISRTYHRILSRGVTEPLTGIFINGDQLRGSDNLREGLEYKGVNSRGRAVLLAIERQFQNRVLGSVRAYAAEGLTGFARRMHFVFPRFVGSEFARSEEERESLFPIPAEDLAALSFRDEQFDLVSTNEVLEHVPDMDKCLQEIARVLRPGGWHIGTVPFRFNSEDSQVRARLLDNQICHFVEPEYHGNPMSSEGSLVFEVPGWDILERCRVAGFAAAHVRFIQSEKYGCLSSDAGGIFVLCARR